MKSLKTLLVATTVLGLGFATTAQADTRINTTTETTLGTPVANTNVNTATNTDVNTTNYFYDKNNNGMMDRDEYVTYSYTTIDYDGDGMIDETEWNDYTTTWYEPIDATYDNTRTFTSYDVNSDGYIETSEYEDAVDYNVYTSWDSNGDGVIDTTEYKTFTTAYADMDTNNRYTWDRTNSDVKTTNYFFDKNNNGMMDRDEYVVYSYTTIDYNNDNMIDETEWNKYTTSWYEPYNMKYDNSRTFVSYDVDGDGYIEASEYEKAVDYDVYTSWDTDNDGMVDTTEYDRMTTTYHDSDKDGVYEWVTVQ